MNNPALDHRRNKASLYQFFFQHQFSMSSVLILTTLILAMAGVISFLIFGSHIKAALEPELFSVSYQFLLIVVLGGAVSLLYKQFSTEQDRDRERRLILRQMHSELLDAFNVAKRVRRTVRARVGYTSDRQALGLRYIIGADYREQMDALMEAQLKFEVYAKRAVERELYFAQGEELNAQCGKIEDYLRQIIKEYEINLTNFDETFPGKQLADLPKLAEFIGPLEEGGKFDINFKCVSSAMLSGLSKASLT